MRKEGRDAGPVILAVRKVGEKIARLEAGLKDVEGSL